MSDPCDKCDRLQETLQGNASPRPHFNQPTMYDHLESFLKYKESKELTKKLKAQKEDLLKFNPKFTDLKIDVQDDIFEQFSTQNIAKFMRSIKENKLNFIEENSEPEDLWKKQYEVKPSASLTTISRSPVFCPISKCGRTIGVTSVLSHFLLDHNEHLGIECDSHYLGDRSIILFHCESLKFRENVCLGVLSYGGIKNQEDTRPAVRGICMQNSFLSQSNSCLKNHLPIFVMICKTSMAAMFDDKNLSEQLMDPEDTSKHILVIWLATVQTTEPIHCTITAFDKSMISSRSTIVQVRNLNSSQNPNDFLCKDTNYLMLNKGEMNILSEEGSESVRVEIKMHEFDI